MLRTNFSKSEVARYEKAIEEYKKESNTDRLTISKDAFNQNGGVVDDCYSLHDSMENDLSGFWIIFERLTMHWK